MKLKDFDYILPPDRIAQTPAPVRDEARLMVLDRAALEVRHTTFADLPQHLRCGDVLVVNETKVVPARLVGRKETGGKIEILLVRRNRGTEKCGSEESEWECLAQPQGKLRAGTSVCFDEGLCGEFLGRNPGGLWRLRLQGEGNIEEKRKRIGFAPLPPYIHRNGDPRMKSRDLERYQTVFARREGAIAAPTAGLHFTESLLERTAEKGIEVVSLTLHVGVGTFLPVKTDEVEKHRLFPERFEISAETAETINRARVSGGRIIAVGTTATRALESSTDEGGNIKPQEGETGLFIIPGYPFRAVDALITNFHLPRSTLLMLVSAFAGRDFILRAYAEAIRKGYRFYSYGDAMFIT